MGPWLNFVGRHDFVTGYRGLSKAVPQALDVFVDTGSEFKGAHSSRSYLDQQAVACASNWLDDELSERRDPPSDVLPDKPIPEALLAILVGAQYALRVEEMMERGDRRDRFAGARKIVLQELPERLRHARLDHPVITRLALDNKAVLKGHAGRIRH